MTDFNPNWFSTDVYDFRKKFGPHSDEYFTLEHNIQRLLLSRSARKVMTPHVRRLYPSFVNVFAGDNQIFVTYLHESKLKLGYICDLPSEYFKEKLTPVHLRDA